MLWPHFFWQIVLLHCSPKCIMKSRSHYLLECPLSITVKNVSHPAVQNWAVAFMCINSSTLKKYFLSWMKILTLILHGRDDSLPLLYILIPSASILFMWIYCLWSGLSQQPQIPRFSIIVWLKISISITEQERDAYVHTYASQCETLCQGPGSFLILCFFC